MSMDSALASGRAAALARMTSTATIARTTGLTEWDEETGVNLPGWETLHEAIPFRLGGSPRGVSQSRTVVIAGVEVSLSVRTAHLPHGTTGLMDGDFIIVTAGERAGQAFQIVEADLADQQTAVRLPVVGVPLPAGWG